MSGARRACRRAPDTARRARRRSTDNHPAPRHAAPGRGRRVEGQGCTSPARRSPTRERPPPDPCATPRHPGDFLCIVDRSETERERPKGARRRREGEQRPGARARGVAAATTYISARAITLMHGSRRYRRQALRECPFVDIPRTFSRQTGRFDSSLRGGMTPPDVTWMCRRRNFISRAI